MPVIILCLAFFAIQVFLNFDTAQKQYTLQELVNASSEHIPLLKQKMALVDAAKASVNETKHAFLPQVRVSKPLNIASDSSLTGSFFAFGITPSTSAGVRRSNKYLSLLQVDCCSQSSFG
ncbi:MAG: hypothetical protein EPO58_15990 [Chitinophagaceae bacterium]|nr:MAG: hypothetical protein EPO58_15990 [Chitinophagaceae bacterium]